MTDANTARRRIKVWDAPTRIVHWSIVILFGLAWWTEQTDRMPLHIVFGCMLLAVLLFRVAWGVWGAETARFASFVRSPAAVAAYGRGLFAKRAVASEAVGHNPMGGWSVAAMLGLLIALSGLGLFCVDEDDVAPGPLAKFIGFEAGQVAAHWHGLVFYGLLILVGLHLAAVGFYAVRRHENLVGPMITGYRRVTGAIKEPRLAPIGLALVLALAAAAIVVAIALAPALRWKLLAGS